MERSGSRMLKYKSDRAPDPERCIKLLTIKFKYDDKPLPKYRAALNSKKAPDKIKFHFIM